MQSKFSGERGAVMLCHSEKLRIFLVEDTPAIERSVKEVLESLNCVVTVASNFTEALNKFDMSFDGVLTDIGLPDGNGFDVVKHIHQNYPKNDITIYIYSAFSVEYIQERISNLPIKGHFGKPFSHDDIQNFVNAVLENKRIVALKKSHSM